MFSVIGLITYIYIYIIAFKGFLFLRSLDMILGSMDVADEKH